MGNLVATKFVATCCVFVELRYVFVVACYIDIVSRYAVVMLCYVVVIMLCCVTSS